MSTCLSLGRGLLAKATTFVEGPVEQLTVLDDPRVLQAENSVYESIAAHVTPFITSLDEATVHVGAMQGMSSRCTPFVRLRAFEESAGFGWRECKVAFDDARRVENRVERMVCEADTALAEKRIMQRLGTARLETVVPKSKVVGDAQFEAISLALWGTALHHPLLRQAAVDFMRANPEEYAGFLGDNFEAYLRGMSRPGMAGDELTLRAVSDHLGVVVNLVTADSFMWFLRYAPRQTKSGREIFLAHIAPYIYLPIRRRSPMTMLRLNLSWSSDKASRSVHAAAAAAQQQAAERQQQQGQQQQQGEQQRFAPATPERSSSNNGSRALPDT